MSPTPTKPVPNPHYPRVLYDKQGNTKLVNNAAEEKDAVGFGRKHVAKPEPTVETATLEQRVSALEAIVAKLTAKE